jgi:hypothetical protein
LLPTEYSNELLRCLAEESFIFPRAKVLPTTHEELEAPRIKIETAPTVSGVSPLLGGIQFQWGFEDAPTETEPNFAMDNFNAWDLLGYCVVSNSWLHDASATYGQGTSGSGGTWATPSTDTKSTRPAKRAFTGAEGYLIDLFGKAAAWYAEYAFLQGSGSALQMPLGILNSPAAIKFTRKTQNLIDITDITAMTSRFLPYSWRNGIWACSPTALAQIQGFAQYYINVELGAEAMSTPRPVGLLSTMPLFVTDKLPPLGVKGDLILIDPSLYVISMRQEVLVDVSHDDALRTNSSTFRIWLRCDGKPELSGSVTLQDTTTKASPYVILNSNPAA